VRLVRYGDDFLILCRDKVTADRMDQQAHAPAEALQLTLNLTTLQVLDFDEPFRCLGFDFQRDKLWTASGRQPQLLEHLVRKDSNGPARTEKR